MLTIRVTDVELEAVRDRALAVGCTLARYVREATLGAPLVVPEARVNAHAVGALERLAGAVHDLRRAAVAGGDPDVAARADATLGAVLAAVDRI